MIDDDELLLSLSTPRIHSAMQGEGSGLIRELDTTIYSAVGLAEADAISGAVVGGPFPGGADALPGPFSVVGVGHDADGLITLSYACYDEEAAAANVPAIEALLASGKTLDGSSYADHFTLQSVEADGYTLTATIELTDPAKGMLPFNMLMSGESLFTTNGG